jgi:small subunit ribosomal protein S6
MRKYDVVFVVQSDLDENAFAALVEKVKGWITEAGGEIEKVDLWGKRRLANPIRKQREGNFVLLQVNCNPAFTATLEHNLRFLEPVLRFLITVND